MHLGVGEKEYISIYISVLILVIGQISCTISDIAKKYNIVHPCILVYAKMLQLANGLLAVAVYFL